MPLYKTSASATPTVLRPTREQGFGQPAAREHAACGANRVVGRRVGAPRTSPPLDLLPDRLELLRWQRSDLVQYSLGLRAHGFNITCSAWKPQEPQLGLSSAQSGQRTEHGGGDR